MEIPIADVATVLAMANGLKSRRIAMAALAFACLGTGACSSDDSSSESQPQKTAQTNAAASAVVTTNQSLVMADTLFNFDPDLDPNGTANQNLDTIKSKISLDGGACATITTILGGFKVDFGSGCTLQSGHTVSGAISVSLQKTDLSKTLTVQLGFKTFAIDSYDLDGTVSLSTSTGSTFEVTIQITHAGENVTGNLTVTGAPTAITWAGNLTVTPSGSTSSTSLTLTDVTIVPKDCYPSGGSVAIDGVGSLAFDSNTATSGQATLTAGNISKCYALPAYGNCVPTACPTKGG